MIERQTAKKVKITWLVNGEFVKKGGMEPSFVRTKTGEEVSRARILATIVSKFIAEDGNYASVTLDDGTDTLRAKVFSTTKPVDKFEIGDVVDVIGKVREYNSEIYMIPEVMRKIEDMNYELLRRLELACDTKNNTGQKITTETKKEAEKKPENKADSVFITGEDAESAGKEGDENKTLKDRILETIEKSDDGIAYSELVISAKGKETETEAAIDELLSEGVCYEPSPGKIKKI